MISRFFIDRPIFASVLSILIVIAGLISLNVLPIAQYPNIIPPEVNVSTTYPGASAETIVNTVAATLEEQINGVPNMIYMDSISTNTGTYSLTVTFKIGTNPDQAAIDVSNRIQTAISRLPEDVIQQGLNVTKKSSSILEILTIYSPDNRYDPIYLSNYALVNIIDELKRVPGVGDANIFGAKDYSMRIWLMPDKLAQYQLTPDDVSAAIKDQNAQFAVGSFGENPTKDSLSFTYNLTTKGQLVTTEEFGNIILKSSQDGGTIRIRDIARVELGSINYDFYSTFNGKPTIAIGIYLLPGANALSTTQNINKKMQELSKRFPASIAYKIPFDTTKFVQISIDEVISTFIKSILLVVAVIYLFLQSARATIIPVIAIPISLIGTFGGMYLLGFTINLLTLFGMVLAIGIVVDDAIVVLENVERIMRTEKLSPKAAAIKAMEEVTGPIIAIVLVLCAVFIPVAFIGGLTGEMYKQFSITIAISTIISGFIALTLTPALCALILKPVDHQPAKFFRYFNEWFNTTTNRYVIGTSYFIKRVGLSCSIFIGMIIIIALLFSRVPSTLVPNEDQGYAYVSTKLLSATSLSRTQNIATEMTKRITSIAQVQDIITLIGFDLLSSSIKSNASTAFVVFKDWQQRQSEDGNIQSLVNRIIGYGSNFKDAVIFAFTPPAITGISRTGGAEGYLQNRSDSGMKNLFDQASKLIKLAKSEPALDSIQVTAESSVPQYYIHLDREKAKALQIPITSVYTTMQKIFGSAYINNFTLYGRIFDVYISADAQYREKPEDIRYTYVRSTDGSMIPLSSLIKTERIVGPDIIERYNMYSSIKIIGQPAPGYSSSQVINAVEKIVSENMSSDYSVQWSGAAYQEKIAGSAGTLAFIIGVVMVFLILSAQYESWSLPLSVITAVPFAVFGAVFAIWLCGIYNDIYFQVGLLTLIGLSAKNAILIVEFAVIQLKQGKTIIEAVMQAARLRFRPIVMTSIAFILGCLPLAISSGAGAASRHSIGISVIGGMLAATLIATFFIPTFFCMILSLFNRNSQKQKLI